MMAAGTEFASAQQALSPYPSSPTNELQRLLAECPHLQAEGRLIRVATKRLRLDCLNAELDLAERVTTFADPKLHGESVVAVFRRTAIKTYKNIQHAVSNHGWTGMDRQALESRLNHLRSLLADLGIREEHLYDSPSVPVPDQPASITKEIHADSLTKRETEVLKAITEGYRTKQVAEMLGITFKTAACHRYRIMDKLGIHDMASLVRYAIRSGLVQL